MTYKWWHCVFLPFWFLYIYIYIFSFPYCSILEKVSRILWKEVMTAGIFVLFLILRESSQLFITKCCVYLVLLFVDTTLYCMSSIIPLDFFLLSPPVGNPGNWPIWATSVAFLGFHWFLLGFSHWRLLEVEEEARREKDEVSEFTWFFHCGFFSGPAASLRGRSRFFLFLCGGVFL